MDEMVKAPVQATRTRSRTQAAGPRGLPTLRRFLILAEIARARLCASTCLADGLPFRVMLFSPLHHLPASRRRLRCTAALCVILVLLGVGGRGSGAEAYAQSAPSATSLLHVPTPLPEAPFSLSDSAEVSLLTMLPGDEVYSLFGHSAFRLHDPQTGLDRTYNYGTFSFDQPFFALRFLRGSLDYLLDSTSYAAEVSKYQYLRRPIIEQRLALPPEAVQELFRVLEWNARSANRAYRYDFLFDNCSTRLLAVLNLALQRSGHPTVSLPPVEEAQTFRELLRPYQQGAPWVGLGMNLALGLPADRTATPREHSFLPMGLLEQFDRARLGKHALVASRDTIFWVPSAGLPAPARPWPLWGMLGLSVLGLSASVAAWRSSTVPRWLRVGDGLLFGVVGLAGVVFVLLWLATEHDVTGPNLNLLWAWPTHLIAAFPLWRAGRPRWVHVYLIATAVGTGLTLLAWSVLPQSLPVAVRPLAALLALRAAARARHHVTTQRLPL